MNPYCTCPACEMSKPPRAPLPPRAQDIRDRAAAGEVVNCECRDGVWVPVDESTMRAFMMPGKETANRDERFRAAIKEAVARFQTQKFWW